MASMIARNLIKNFKNNNNVKNILQRGLATKIDGNAVASEIRAEIAAATAELSSKYGKQPGLAVVLVGDRPDSAKYVSMKKKAAKEVGIASFETVLPEDVDEELLVQKVSELNANPDVDGILVQLPLPEHVNQKRVLACIETGKDVDGFHPQNIGALLRSGEECRQDRVPWDGLAMGNAPCTPLGCVELIDRAGVELSGANVVVVGRSNIVGLPVATMLLHRNATVTCCHSRTQDLPGIVKQADIVIAAIGQPEFVKADWIKPGACVIDVGVNFKDDPSRKSGRRMCGDVEYAAAFEVAGQITPVPGGVGPMTICMLMKNTLTNFERRMN